MVARQIPRLVVIAIVFLAAPQSSAQDTPDVLTKAEWRCQLQTAKSASRYAASTTDCLLACEEAARTDPLRLCGPFSFDATTRFCLDRAETTPRIRMLRQCAGERCPECYRRADCDSFSGSALNTSRFNTSQRLQPVLCDDSASPDGLTAGEARCRERVAESMARLQEHRRRCFSSCNKRRQKGKTTAEACDPTNLDTEDADEKLQSCIFKARIRFLRSCLQCDDQPECWATTFPTASCTDLMTLVESQSMFDEERYFCADQATCGDGFISGDEQCDIGIFPDGCDPDTSFCDTDCNCTEFPVCGDGQITGFEFCDQSAVPTGCGAAEECIGCSFCVADPCAVVTPIGAGGGTFQGTTPGTGNSGIRGSCGGSGSEDTYSWTPDASGLARIETCGSSFDTVLHVRRDACGLDGVEVACNDDSCGLSSRVQFNVQAGTTYYIYVDGFSFGGSGAYRLTVTPPGGIYGSPQRAFLHGELDLFD